MSLCPASVSSSLVCSITFELLFCDVSQNHKNKMQMKTSTIISYNLIILKRKIKLVGRVCVGGLTTHRKLGTESAFLRLNPELPMTPYGSLGSVGQFILI